MKFIILILLFTLMPMRSFCQGTVSKSGKFFNAKSSGNFNVNIVKTLRISKNSQMIELSSFKPGEERTYNEVNIASTFDLSGAAGKKVGITVKMYCSNKEIVIEDAVCEYKESNIWKRISGGIYDGSDFVFDFALNLDNQGTRSLRIYPKKIKAGTALETDTSVVFLIIEINYEYKDM